MRKLLAVPKGDILAISIVLLSALAVLALLTLQSSRRPPAKYAEIYQNGALVQSVRLASEPQTLRIEHESGYNLLQITAEGVRIIEADCPNGDCVRIGLQSRAGGVLACLPHNLLIKLTGGAEDDIDAIAH